MQSPAGRIYDAAFPPRMPLNVRFSGSSADSLKIGYAVQYKQSPGSASERHFYVEQPSLAGLLAGDFAGVITGIGQNVGTNLREVEIISLDQAMRGAQVWTDENLAVGTLLGPIPDSFAFGRAVVTRPVARCLVAIDRSGTAGLASVRWGGITREEIVNSRLIGEWADDFRRPNVPGVVAGALANHNYLLKGTTAVAEQAVNGGTPAGTGLGELTVIGTTTTIGQIQQIGAQWLLNADRALFCRQRVKIDDISDEDWFFGLGTPPTVSAGVLTGVDQLAAAQAAPVGTDYMGFFFDATGGNNTNLNFNIRKASGTQQFVDLGIALVNNTYIDLAFLARNRASGTAAGAKVVQVYINNALITTFNSAAQAAAFPDTVPLAWALSGITGGCRGTISDLLIRAHL